MKIGRKEIYLTVCIVFLALGILLPSTISTANPRPGVQTFLLFLFPLHHPLRALGARDTVIAPVNIMTTLLWALAVSYAICRIGRMKKKTPSA